MTIDLAIAAIRATLFGKAVIGEEQVPSLKYHTAITVY